MQDNFSFFEAEANGTVVLTGYPKIEKLPPPSCSTDCSTAPERERCLTENNCQQPELVHFVFTAGGNEDFSKYLYEITAATKSEPNIVKLGCVKNSRITYENESLDFGSKTYWLPKDTTDSILQATIDKPIKLKLTKLLTADASADTACSSLFTRIEIESPQEET